MSEGRKASQVPAAAQVLAILHFMGQQAGPLPAASIAREVGLPRSTTYHLLAALIEEGFIVHLPEEQKYALGVTAHELGTGYARQAPLHRIARFPLRQLVKRTRRTSHLAVMHGRDVIYVLVERAPRQLPLVTDIGVRLPAHLTASGRAMMASMTAAQVAALYPGPEAFAVRHEQDHPTCLAELQDLLHRTREIGFASEVDQITEGFSSVAVPVLDRADYPVASVTLTASNRRTVKDGGAVHDGDSHQPDVDIEEFGRTWIHDVNSCAREITRRLRNESSRA